MKTRFEQLAVCTMFLVLAALIACHRFFPSPTMPSQSESSRISVETLRPAAPPQLTTPETSSEHSPSETAEPAGESLSRLEIRVSLTNVPVRSLKLRCESSLNILAIGSGITLREESRLETCPASAGKNGLTLGSLEFEEPAIELVPSSSPALWVNGSQYRGRLRLFRTRSGRIRIVNVVALEDYLASVVDSEMPIAFGREARKAQCIASRTYAMYQMLQRESHPQFDLFATEQSQKYLGTKYRNSRGQLWAGESGDSREVVTQTAGLVCTFDGDLFCTYFSATCGGRTNCGTDMFSDAVPPLCGVDCAWCRDSPDFRWTRTLAPSDRVRLTPTGDPKTLLDVRPTDRIMLSDGLQDIELSAKEIREEVLPDRLLSPMFVVTRSGSQTIISGRGHGHGVGMCQWGARGLAEAGRSAREILAYYYPGCEVVRWDSGDLGFPQKTSVSYSNTTSPDSE